MNKSSKPSKSEVLLIYLIIGAIITLIIFIAGHINFEKFLGTALLVGLALMCFLAPRR